MSGAVVAGGCKGHGRRRAGVEQCHADRGKNGMVELGLGSQEGIFNKRELLHGSQILEEVM
jgi:hypothetical protein